MGLYLPARPAANACRRRLAHPTVAPYTAGMGAGTIYFRRHRWQRRLLTGMLAVTVGAVAALLGYPAVRDYRLIHRLGSPDPAVREQAIAEAIALGAEREETRRRLESALDTADDRRFAAVAGVLSRLGRFHVPGRDPAVLDRRHAVELELSPAPSAREFLAAELLLDGRDNPHVRRAARAAAADASPEVRAVGALLSARLGEDPLLFALLDDADPNPASTAALAAALAGRTALLPALQKKFPHAEGDVLCAVAYALARLEGSGAAERIATKIASAGDESVRERLLHALVVAGGESARRFAVDALVAARSTKRLPSGAELLAAGRLDAPRTAEAVREVLSTAAEGRRDVLVGQLRAAIAVALERNLPCRAEAWNVCRKLWSRPLELTMVPTARLLGAQASATPPTETTEPTREDCLIALRQAVAYSGPAPAIAPAAATEPADTPLASAAAAVELWLLGDPGGELFVTDAAAAETTLPGDYVAWRLARSGRDNAFPLGLTMLPPPVDPSLPPDRQPPRVYNAHERAAGAMLLALAARTPEQRTAAERRIRLRLEGGPTGAREENWFACGALQCALVILSDRTQLPAVRGLLAIPEFPQRRALTALIAADDRPAMRWLLWDRDADEIGYLLADRGVGEVLAFYRPDLPAVDFAAGEDLRCWQAAILRCAWALGTEGKR